jgi:3-oxoacyl-[acyl-carrier-protein] synthase-3
MFGDGAGAIVISAGKSDGHAKLLASTFGADTLAPLMHYRGGGASAPTNPDTTVLHRYEIDAIEVAAHFGKLLGKAIHDLKAIHDFKLYDIQRFYFHQANLRLVEKFADEIGIPMSKVAVNVDRYGNTAAASTLILLDEDVRWGRIQQGDLCLLAAMGAGAHYGAALIRW